jgi:hypothetical protein
MSEDSWNRHRPKRCVRVSNAVQRYSFAEATLAAHAVSKRARLHHDVDVALVVELKHLVDLHHLLHVLEDCQVLNLFVHDLPVTAPACCHLAVSAARGAVYMRVLITCGTEQDAHVRSTAALARRAGQTETKLRAHSRGVMCLMATSLFVALCLPLITLAKPPLPSPATNSYTSLISCATEEHVTAMP